MVLKKNNLKRIIPSNKTIFVLVVIVTVSMFSYSVAYTKKSIEDAKQVNEEFSSLLIDQESFSIVEEYNSYFKDVSDDLLFLSKLSSLKKLYSSPLLTNELEQDYLSYMKESNDYYQLRYIDKGGQEIVRIDNDMINYTVVSKENLQNKSGRYYFDDTMVLKEGQIFISPLDLNIERGIIENRGTISKPKYVPVIRFATPVFDDEDNPRGIVILNLYMDYLLNLVKRANSESEQVFLINDEGYYLAHEDYLKEYSFMFEGVNHNFFSDYEVDKTNIEDFAKYELVGDRLFHYDYIYPLLSTFGSSSSKSFAEDYWVLVTITEQGNLSTPVGGYNYDHFLILFMSFIVNLFLIVSAGIMAFRR